MFIRKVRLKPDRSRSVRLQADREAVVVSGFSRTRID